MIRKELPDGWLLVTHGEHARLAGLFAEAWGNAQFAAPEPRAAILCAVASHDDGWAARDAAPFLTKAAVPEAFTKDLVGSYSAFEEIDLPAYLRVRGEATATVAARNPFASIVVSMHTVNLLTEQADHIAYIVNRVQQAEAKTVEVTPEGEQECVDTIHDSGMDTTKFQMECTPGYYNNEGQVRRGGGFTGGQYGGGPIRFFQILAEWREEGNLRGCAME